jgi:hypothetical protein
LLLAAWFLLVNSIARIYCCFIAKSFRSVVAVVAPMTTLTPMSSAASHRCFVTMMVVLPLFQLFNRSMAPTRTHPLWLSVIWPALRPSSVLRTRRRMATRPRPVLSLRTRLTHHTTPLALVQECHRVPARTMHTAVKRMDLETSSPRETWLPSHSRLLRP